MIIAGYSGIGKTTTAKLRPQEVVDFVCMPYKYYLDKDKLIDESCKANPDYVMRREWPFNYISAIKSAFDDSKVLLIPSDIFVLNLLSCEEIPYFLCYPERSAKEVYRKRFLERGNKKEFIDIFIGRWNEFITSFEEDEFGSRIVLRSDQYLDDVIENILRKL
jgi:hypothetical protein